MDSNNGYNFKLPQPLSSFVLSLATLVVAIHDNSPPFTTSLSSRLNWEKHTAISSTISYVAFISESPFQWINTWVTTWSFYFAILLSSIACSCRPKTWGRFGRVLCTGRFLTCLLNWETWNTRWMAEESGSSILYAIFPILSITKQGPKNLTDNFCDDLQTTDCCNLMYT